MNVLVDTSVWSLALRRQRRDRSPYTAELGELIREGRALLVGAVRQELLSGIREPSQFHRLRDALRAFVGVVVRRGDYERAADFFNRCRGQGVQGSNTDFLLCALADRVGAAILTTDRDFERFAEHIPVRIHRPR